MAEVFLDDFDELRSVGFRDGDKTNHELRNLYMGPALKNSRGLEAYQIQVVETGEIFESPSRLARSLNGYTGEVMRVILGEVETYRDRHFRLIPRKKPEPVKRETGGYSKHLQRLREAQNSDG